MLKFFDQFPFENFPYASVKILCCEQNMEQEIFIKKKKFPSILKIIDKSCNASYLMFFQTFLEYLLNVQVNLQAYTSCLLLFLLKKLKSSEFHCV